MAKGWAIRPVLVVAPMAGRGWATRPVPVVVPAPAMFRVLQAAPAPVLGLTAIPPVPVGAKAVAPVADKAWATPQGLVGVKVAVLVAVAPAASR